MTETLEIGLLGRIRFGDGNIDKLPKKAQALLAYLAMNRGRAIPRDRLADLLWSTSGPEQGRQSLRQSLAAVRRALGADARDLIETVGAAAQRLIAFDPLREDGHRLLMQLYASVGRRAEAVRQFAVCADSLRRKLD